jgi:hypothetical protein
MASHLLDAPSADKVAELIRLPVPLSRVWPDVVACGCYLYIVADSAVFA